MPCNIFSLKYYKLLHGRDRVYLFTCLISSVLKRKTNIGLLDFEGHKDLGATLSCMALGKPLHLSEPASSVKGERGKDYREHSAGCKASRQQPALQELFLNWGLEDSS